MISIIGAGPSGSYLAFLLAKSGKKVQIFEEHSSVGRPVQCTGIVTSSISRFIRLKKEFVINRPNSFSETKHKDILLIIRPESVQIDEDGEYKGKVQKIFFHGSYKLITIILNQDYKLWSIVPSSYQLQVNQSLRFNIKYEHIYALDEI